MDRIYNITLATVALCLIPTTATPATVRTPPRLEMPASSPGNFHSEALLDTSQVEWGE